MAITYKVSSLKQIHDVVRDHGDEEGVRVSFSGYLAKLAEAQGIENLLARKEKEEGWKVEISNLKQFVIIDRAIGDAHGLLCYILHITEPSDADIPSSSVDKASVKCITKLVYGTAAYAQGVADQLFNRPNARSASFEGRRDAKFPGHSASIERRREQARP